MSFLLQKKVITIAKGKYEYWITEEGLTLISGWTRRGMTDAEIAGAMGIRRETLIVWKKKYSNIANTLKKTKEIVDYEVEKSLHKKATGYTAKETKAFKCKEIYYDDAGHRCERETVQVVEVDTYVPADTLAAAIWLNNRMSDEWKRNANKEKLDKDKFEHQKDIDNKRHF